MSSPTYRKNAVAHLSSPEQLDTAVRVTRPRSWIALAAVGLLLVAFVVWCLVGSVQTTFPGAGVLLTQYGTFDSVSPQAGQVTAVFVAPGDDVAAGDPLAAVETADAGETTVTAANDGRVVEMLAFPSDRIEAGAPIVTIQPDDDDLHCFIYVPVSGRQPIREGMPVQISVTTIPSEQYGLLLGTVERVGSYPATREGVNALLNNRDITEIVVGGAPVIQVEVTLTPASTPSGYAWTSGEGPPEPLIPGTLINASVITAVEPPISLLFPSDRQAG
ncbi:HlyD family efflux transporter periplasmic adaptor subunit [Agromyces sp. NPDC057865]|uniref:HlyD family efflux transporter periplasmic adaptor subunit n=1 Tax=Agromyces sp. NPDC057865 TaxID=3346267 RepID=UPI00366B2ECE